MNDHDDAMDEVLERALTRHADDAPGAAGLLEQVGAAVRRRRTRRRVTAVAAALLAGITIPLGAIWLSGQTERPPIAADRPSVEEQVSGKDVAGRPTEFDGNVGEASGKFADSAAKWESYGGIEAQVPANWERGTWGPVDCPNKPSKQPNPNGPVADVLCSGRVPTVEERKPAIWFDWRGQRTVDSHPGGWVLETRVVGKVRVTVYTDDDKLRARVFDSTRHVEGVDGNGCTPDHQATIDPGYRPTTNGGLDAIGPVRSMSLCHYTIDPHDKQIVSSSVLTGGGGQRILDGILAVPEGGGPDDPSRLCNRWNLRGEDLMVLVVRGAERTQEVLVRYSGCKGNGIDDGATKRALSAQVLRSLFTGSHHYEKLGVRVTYMLYPK